MARSIGKIRSRGHTGTARAKDVLIPSGSATLEGESKVPAGAEGVVLLAHGSGSSRHSPRNQFVAHTIREAGVGALLFDLLTREEVVVDIHTRHLRFDIPLLAHHLVNATGWEADERLVEVKRTPLSVALRSRSHAPKLKKPVDFRVSGLHGPIEAPPGRG